MNKFNFLIVFAICFLFLFSGCSAKVEDCSGLDSVYENYAWDEELKECIVSQTLQRDVCGNGIAEDGETYCNCPESGGGDVAEDDPEYGCSGNKGVYLEFMCSEENECVLEVNDKIEDITARKDFDINSGAFNLEILASYKQPFMIDRHWMEVEVFLKKLEDSSKKKISNVRIKTISIETRDGEVLGYIEWNKAFTDLYQRSDVPIQLDRVSMSTFDKKYRFVNVVLFGTYDKIEYNTQGEIYKDDKNLPIEIKYQFDSEFDVINPNNVDAGMADEDTDVWD